MTIPNGRPPSASAWQILEAYKKYKSVPRVCAELHAGAARVERILVDAGIVRWKRNSTKNKRNPENIPENYVLAIADYQKGVTTPVLKEQYNISFPSLYRWMDDLGIARRAPLKEPKDWHCWECGLKVSYGEMFCCDEHRREYNNAAIALGFKPPAHHRREDLLCQNTV